MDCVQIILTKEIRKQKATRAMILPAAVINDSLWGGAGNDSRFEKMLKRIFSFTNLAMEKTLFTDSRIMPCTN